MFIIAIILWKDDEISVSDMSGEGRNYKRRTTL